ncbi:MAG TPA: hypothetical protein PLL98_01895 [Bacillota bacterium]|nr:hypothetical protein [Bacillota bacterium]HOR85216.1 hypothetical protein [Bacillota bacterium]HPL53409.1 hypothetical protein [Bacillota bacterium]
MANIYGGVNRCAPPAYCRPGTAVAPIATACKCNSNGFLLLLLLFILLAAGPSWGIDNSFFFIIILAIIAFGGFGRTFGFSGAL